MAWSRGRQAAVAALVLVGVLGYLLLTRPNDERQIDTLFRTAADALDRADATTLVDLVDDDFDLAAIAPGLVTEAANSIADPEEQRQAVRDALRRDLARLLLLLRTRDDLPDLSWRVVDHRASGAANDLVEATVTLGVLGGPARIEPARSFTLLLARHGFLRPSLRIREITPFPFSIPSEHL